MSSGLSDQLRVGSVNSAEEICHDRPTKAENLLPYNREFSLDEPEKAEKLLSYNQEFSQNQPAKLPKLLAYNREFLLSLREKEICKKLPNGFDVSILSEIEEAASHPPDWQRGVGSSTSYSSRRGEFGPSSYSRVDGSGSYSRGMNSRWETRSNVSIDKDGNQTVDPDHGRRSANQHRRLGQKPEQDGLLGSGVFPRSSGQNQSWASTLKDKGEGHYQLNKCNEPYQPPRSQKSGSQFRKDYTDTYNDETFGSSECSDQKQEEEERMRRESFELMRKEQRKVLEGMQKSNAGKNEESDISSLLDSRQTDQVFQSRTDEKLESKNMVHLVSSSECLKKTSTAKNAPARPLVPPGFASSHSDTTSSKQLPSLSVAFKVERNGNKDDSRLISNNFVANAEEHPLSTGDDFDLDKQVIDYIESLASKMALSDNSRHAENPPGNAAVTSENSKQENILVHESTENETSVADFSLQIPSGTTVGKLFGLDLKEDSYVPAAESFSTEGTVWSNSLSSKFEMWFQQHTAKPSDSPQEPSRNILSRIVGTENDASRLTPFPEGSLQNSFGILEIQPRSYSLPIPESSVLTCEDLEQSMLAEVQGTNSVINPTPNPTGNSPGSDVYNEASEHLLTLLQKGPAQSKDDKSMSEDKTNFGDFTLDDSKTATTESSKTLTLESLFGSAFMQELHSMDAPISGLRPKVDGSLPGDTTIPSDFPIKLEKSLTSREIDDDTRHRPENLAFPAMNQGDRLSLSPLPSQMARPDVSSHHLHGQPPPSGLPFPHSSHEMMPGYAHQLENIASHHHDPLQQFFANPSLHLQQRFDSRFHLQMPPQPMPMPMERDFTHHPQYFPRGGPLPYTIAGSHPEAMHHALQGHHNKMVYRTRIPGMPMEAEPQQQQHHHYPHHEHHPHEQLNTQDAHLSGLGLVQFFNPELSSGPRNRQRH